MAKALKPLLIILLLLSITSLALGILLFKKRDIVKGRTQKLEQTVVSVASSLNAAKEPFIRDLGVNIDSSQLMSYESMGSQLDNLQKLASVRYEELDTTYGDLKKTKDDLTATKDELATTKGELDTANQQIATLNQTIAQKDTEIAEGKAQVETLNQQVAGLQSQITDLNGQVTRIQEEKNELNDKIAEMNQDIKGLEQELAEARQDTSIEAHMKKGLAGQIVVVNKDWNFVVVDVGSDAGALINGVFLVHRADKLIGKIRVSSVSRNLALAEIINDWQTTPFREGDKIVN